MRRLLQRYFQLFFAALAVLLLVVSASPAMAAQGTALGASGSSSESDSLPATSALFGETSAPTGNIYDESDALPPTLAYALFALAGLFACAGIILLRPRPLRALARLLLARRLAAWQAKAARTADPQQESERAAAPEGAARRGGIRSILAQ